MVYIGMIQTGHLDFKTLVIAQNPEEATANILKKFPKEAGNLFQKEDICLKPFSQSKASPTF